MDFFFRMQHLLHQDQNIYAWLICYSTNAQNLPRMTCIFRLVCLLWHYTVFSQCRHRCLETLKMIFNAKCFSTLSNILNVKTWNWWTCILKEVLIEWYFALSNKRIALSVINILLFADDHSQIVLSKNRFNNIPQ